MASPRLLTILQPTISLLEHEGKIIISVLGPDSIYRELTSVWPEKAYEIFGKDPAVNV